jgi:hypothetical protein
MNWFDEFSVALAAKNVPRGTALKNVARVAASAFLFPWASTATAALAQTPSPTRRGAGLAATRVRPVAGVPALLPARLPSTTRIGPCTHRSGGQGNGLLYSASSSANGRALRLTVEQQSVVQRAASGKPLVGGTSTITVTSGGAQVLRIEASFNPIAAGVPASGNVSVTYGALVRGLSSASLAIDRGTISGTVNGRTLAATTARNATAPEQVRFADARPFPRIDIDPALRDAIAALFEMANTDLSSCAPSTPARRPRRPKRTHTRAVAAWDDGAVIAQTSPDYQRTTDQNWLGRDGDGTPDCRACYQNVMVSWAKCMVGAGATAWLCPPCAIGSVANCYTSVAVGIGLCYVPDAGGCAEVLCPSVGSCDHTYTCCGQQICCPSGDVCNSNGVCCPAENPVACGTTRPTCCASGSTCCGGSCCPAGSVCSADGTCSTCPPGQTNCGGTACCAAGKVCHNGKCCDFLCGDDCCVNGEVCNHATGTCGYGGVCGGQFCTFTQACVNGRCVNVTTPSSPPKPSQYMRCRAGLFTCHSPNADGTVTTVCCPNNWQCCAGVCCAAPNETCCSRGGSLGCNVCIR